MKCPECYANNRERAKFCVSCGARLVLVCSQCGTELPASAKFCDECGGHVAAPRAQREEEPVARDTLAERLQRLVPKAFAERLLARRGQSEQERCRVYANEYHPESCGSATGTAGRYGATTATALI